MHSGAAGVPTAGELIGHPPIDEEGAFVMERGFEPAVAHAEIVHFTATLAKLALQARHVGVHENRRLRRHQRGAWADDKNEPLGHGDFISGGGKFGVIQKIFDAQVAEAAENGIIAAEIGGDEGVDFAGGLEDFSGFDR